MANGSRGRSVVRGISSVRIMDLSPPELPLPSVAVCCCTGAAARASNPPPTPSSHLNCQTAMSNAPEPSTTVCQWLLHSAQSAPLHHCTTHLTHTSLSISRLNLTTSRPLSRARFRSHAFPLSLALPTAQAGSLAAAPRASTVLHRLQASCITIIRRAIGGAPGPTVQPMGHAGWLDPCRLLSALSLYAEISATMVRLASRQHAQKANLCFDSAAKGRASVGSFRSGNPSNPTSPLPNARTVP